MNQQVRGVESIQISNFPFSIFHFRTKATINVFRESGFDRSRPSEDIVKCNNQKKTLLVSDNRSKVEDQQSMIGVTHQEGQMELQELTQAW